MIAKDTILSFLLCNNVTPVQNEKDERQLEASSPDEIALVMQAESMGIKLLNRTEKKFTLQAPKITEEKFQLQG